jgi:hypothetical protein
MSPTVRKEEEDRDAAEPAMEFDRTLKANAKNPDPDGSPRDGQEHQREVVPTRGAKFLSKQMTQSSSSAELIHAQVAEDNCELRVAAL